MRRLFGFLAVVLIPATTLFAQQRSNGSSSSSSGNSSASSSSSSYSPPSYSPPSSSGSSRSSDSGGSRSSDSGSRSSPSSSSSYGGGSYAPPSRSSSEPSSRSSSTNTSGSSYHSNSTSNSSGYSNSGNVRDSRNVPQVQNRREFPTNLPAKEPASTFHGTEQPASREGLLPGSNHANLERNARPSATSKIPYDPQLLEKYSPKEAKILEKQSRLDAESDKLYTKYKLAGKDAEYERKQAKLDEKRNKLQNKELNLTKKYQLEAEKKFRPCRGRDCTSQCPPGSIAGHRGCVPAPPGIPNPQCGNGYHQYGNSCVLNSQQCTSGYRWDGRQCIDEALNTGNSFGANCNEYYVRLQEQKKILDNLRQSQQSACTGTTGSAECDNYTQQVLMAETRYRQLQQEYSQCLVHP